MRVPLSWLREYCDPPLTTAEIGDRLAMTGTEPERIEHFGVPSADGFVIGKVLEAEQHPNADRLRVCRVDDGNGSRTIVCGAPNVAAGQTVALALPGAVMPGGQRLGEAKLRGVVSSGMILAEDEVGVGEDHNGIMVLPDELRAGAPLLEYLTIFDDVLDLEVEPNRPDCLSVYGVARELHAVTGAPLAADPTGEDAVASGDDSVADHASVEIADPDVCPRFTARVFDGVHVGPSPLWLKARLAAAGQRSISNVVDITNYVMLLTGQPLHAFDLDEVRGRRIVVRRARDGERMVTLDGVERTFDSSMALVCDAEGPSGVAGIMGGRVSEVSERTTRVLMEAATWVGPNVLQSSARLGLRSEASTRFEKQLHPEQALAAQRLAARLMVELCGARMAPGTIDEYPGRAEPRVVALRHRRIGALLGTEIPRAEVEAILGRLSFATVPTEAGFDVTVPPFRDADVQREADLIEEIARIHGLERLPATLPARRHAVGRLTPAQRVRRRVEDALRDRGLCEVVAYSFTAPDTLARLRLEEGTLAVGNPLSEDASVMRPLLLPGLLGAAARNAARGRPGVALFESAHVYRPGEAAEPPPLAAASVPADEHHHVAALLTRSAPGTWRRPALAADYFAAKGLVEAMLGSLGITFSAEPAQRPFLHPGRSAAVTSGGEELGWIGELHPAVAREWDVGEAAAFELDLETLAELAPAAAGYRDVTTLPPVLQDIAVVVPESVSAAEVDAAVRRGAGDLLSETTLFDVYRGEQVGEGNRSLALRLEFRAPDRTLTDDDVAGLRGQIERELETIGGGCVHRTAVIGASGFAGALCAALVQGHPSLELSVATARSDAGRRLDEVYPRHRVPVELEYFDPDRVAERADVALVAYPHGASAPVTRDLLDRGLKVVDLSADFRLDRASYERYYGAHAAPELLDRAVYGLTELHREAVAQADLVAGPGCFPSAAILALAPLRGLIADVVVDAKTGVSGAGREATQITHFVSVTDNVNSYKVEGHRHRAELEQEIATGDGEPPITFTPHLLPIDQGLLASCYVTAARDLSAGDLRELFEDAYGGEPFVDLAASPPGVRDVRETNRCRIHATVEPATGRVLVFAVIDNLWKGAAGQAVQDLNVMLGLPESDGLT